MAAGLFNIHNYRTDTKKEEEGTWVTISGAGIDGPKVKIARWGNKHFQTLQRELSLKYATQLASKDSSVIETVTRNMYVELLAYTILLDVSGLSLDGETEWKYTPEEGAKLLNDDGFHDLLDNIETQSRDATNFRPDRTPSAESEAAAAKTVKKASSSTKK